MIRRAFAVTILTAAALFFASRFHGPPSEAALPVDEPAVVAPAPTTTATTSVASTTAPDEPAASTTTISSTIPEPMFTLPTKPPTTTTTTIPLPIDTGDGIIYEGSRFRTRWGSIKVEISVIDGVMVDIDIVMVPKGTRRSRALTQEHEPTLKYQALTRQSPRVDVITGATEISEGYGWSLYVAMEEAGLWPPASG
jgi:uncharacterized protein with FMN-binding domain